MTTRARPVQGADGVLRSPEAEAAIDAMVAAVLARPAGQKLLGYLKSLTVHQVLGPAASDAELRHLEGQRFIVALMERRCERGKRNRGRGGSGGIIVADDRAGAGVDEPDGDGPS